jgi:hypothetical protein
MSGCLVLFEPIVPEGRLQRREAVGLYGGRLAFDPHPPPSKLPDLTFPFNNNKAV